MSVRPRKRVALVGSSGGGAATLGHLSPSSLVSNLRRELSHAGIDLVSTLLVVCNNPLDYAGPDSDASLHVLVDGELQVISSGTLENTDANASVNHTVRAIDAALTGKQIDDPDRPPIPAHVPAHVVAGMPKWTDLDGLVAISSSPTDVNRGAFDVMSRLKRPVVATGGTSVGQMAANGVLVVGGSGGSVATTPASKSIVAAASLAGYWGLPYEPSASSGASLRSSIALHSVLDGVLPLVLAGCLTRWVAGVLVYVLPRLVSRVLRVELLLDALASGRVLSAAVSAVAGSESCGGLGVLGLLAGSFAGTITSEGGGGVLAAALAGSAAGILLPKFVAFAARHGTPATATSIVSSGAAGALAGTVFLLLRLTDMTVWISNLVRNVLAFYDSSGGGAAWFGPTLRTLSGGLMGWLVFWGSEHGAYHALILPLIIIESEFGDFAFLGAMDCVCLVCVCLGLCGGTYLAPQTPSDRALSARGIKINSMWGDFVECGYPFMSRDRVVMYSAHIGAALGGALVGLYGIHSSAYLPLPLCILTTQRPLGLLLAAAAAAAPPFVATWARGNEAQKAR